MRNALAIMAGVAFLVLTPAGSAMAAEESPMPGCTSEQPKLYNLHRVWFCKGQWWSWRIETNPTPGANEVQTQGRQQQPIT